jgi:sigma-B regulation protein RsbU (phosphoserine phosphatase)
MTPAQGEFMQCMEVWGGNQATDKTVALSGLDVWVYSQPFGGSSGGGDVYYLSSCATNRILRILVADVSGHGQAVQELALQLRSLMRRYVNHIDQAQFVSSMNQQFAALAKTGLFATAIVSTYFAPTCRLTLCNAGHPPPLIYRASRGEWIYLEEANDPDNTEPTNLPLGILDAADYESFDVTLRAGDLVLCYTDSLVESRRPDGQLLGQCGLLEIVGDLPIGDPAALISNLLVAVGRVADGNLTEDDVTALLLRANDSGVHRPPLGERVAALGRVVAAAAESVRRADNRIPWPDLRLANIGGAFLGPLNRLWAGSDDGERER